MPKRSSEVEKESEKYEKMRKQVKMYDEQKLNTNQRNRTLFQLSDSEESTDVDHGDNIPSSELQVVSDRSRMPESPEPRSLPVSSTPAPAPEPLATDRDALDPELLEALGDANDETPGYGPEIHSHLSKVWLPILQKGLNSDTKASLLEKYVIPRNCNLLKAPTLNKELQDFTRSDHFKENEQTQLGLGITAIGRAITVLLTNDNNKAKEASIKAMKILSDGCRILLDVHFNQTNVRRKILTSKYRDLRKHVQELVRDDTLFGKKFSKKFKEWNEGNVKTPTTSNPPRSTSSRGRGGTQHQRQYQNNGVAPEHPTPGTSSSTTRTNARYDQMRY